MATEDEDTKTPRFGVTPSIAGAAAFEGLPHVLSAVLGDAPMGLARMVESGVPIEAPFGTPLSQLAEFTRAEAKAIADFARARGVTVPIVSSQGMPTAFVDEYDPVRKMFRKILGKPTGTFTPHIRLGQSSIPQAFHEIGHASPIAGSHDLRRVFQALGSTIGGGSTFGHLLRGAIAMSGAVAPTEDSSAVHRFVADNAPALVGATLMPELIDEARASIHAIRGAGKSGYGAMRAVKELVPYFGTYLGAAAAPVLATIVARRVMDAMRGEHGRKAEDEKTAAASAMIKAPGALRSSASSAWHMGTSTPKPKSIGPGKVGGLAKERAQAKPPSKTAFYKDMLESLYNPARGSRLATPG